MNIDTGAKIHSYHWKELPISDKLVDAVNKIGEDQGMPSFANKALCFEWHPNVPILDVDKDQTIADEFQEKTLPYDEDYDTNVNDPNDIEIEDISEEDEDELNDEETYNEESDADTDDDDDSENTNDNDSDSNTDDEEESSSEDDSDSDNDDNKNSIDESSTSDENDEDQSSEAGSDDSSEARSDADLNISTDSSVFVPRRTKRTNVAQGVERIVPLNKGKSHGSKKTIQLTQVDEFSDIYTPSTLHSYKDSPSKYEKIENFGADPVPPSHFEIFEKQFLQHVKKANKNDKVIDAANFMQISNEIMFVQLPEKYTEFSQMPAHVGIQKFGEEAICNANRIHTVGPRIGGGQTGY